MKVSSSCSCSCAEISTKLESDSVSRGDDGKVVQIGSSPVRALPGILLGAKIGLFAGAAVILAICLTLGLEIHSPDNLSGVYGVLHCAATRIFVDGRRLF